MLIIRAIRKYGKNSFTWKILKTCQNLEELNQEEEKYIALHKPKYNIRPGGVNSRHAEATKKKISNLQKKKILCVDDQICFFSVLDAEAFYKAGNGTIGRVARGLRNTYRGKKFAFINTQLQRTTEPELTKENFIANRRFQRVQSLSREVKILHAKVAIGASGAPTLDTDASVGVASVTRDSAGVYVVTLEDKYSSLLHVDVMQVAASAEDLTFQVEAEAVATAKTVQVQCKAAAVETDPSDGSSLLIRMELKNTSVVR